MNIVINELANFLLTANQKGYAGRKNGTWVEEKDLSTSINFQADPWRLHDNYFGGQPYGGRMVVFYNDQPVWIMVYYGWTCGTLPKKTVYTMLQNALLHMPADKPFRGPANYTGGPFCYTNAWDGELEHFSGTEKIMHNDTLVYQGQYIGGLVDQERAPSNRI
jgi:hypothetical protein